MTKRASLKDIAEKVGVSKALVSYVMNGLEKEKRVGADIVKEIRKAAHELNYRPNQIAQSLRTGETKTIGLIVADIANPFFGNLARVIEDEAFRLGYTVIFGSSDEDFKKSELLIETLLNRQVDGFIIVPAENTSEQIFFIHKKGIPMVLIDRYFPEIESSFVILDNYGASFEAVSHLVGNGYKRIAMISYKSGLIHMKERIRGYVEAMNYFNLADNILIKEISYSNLNYDVDIAITGIMNEPEKIDALFFATNALTISGLYSIKNKGFKIPDQIAIVGFDGNEAFDFFYSPITYIEQPISEIGIKSVQLLVQQITESEVFESVKLKHRLVKRMSSKKCL